MARRKYSTDAQRFDAIHASVQREKQRRKLVTLTQRLMEQRPDYAGFVAEFWAARRRYLDLERHLENLLWKEGVFKRPLLLELSVDQHKQKRSSDP